MVSLITGEKGKGKTKYLLEMANAAVTTAAGNIVYIDKNNKHMYELNRKVRLIDASRFPLKSADSFLGFLCGIASQDHDLEKVFLDSSLKNAKLGQDPKEIAEFIAELEKISKLFQVDFVLSVSLNKEDLDPSLHDKISISL